MLLPEPDRDGGVGAGREGVSEERLYDMAMVVP